MKIHVLSGFLGSGKTTAIEQASRRLLEKNIKTGVISNDQGIKLVDAVFFKNLNIPGRQVGNGCFCCNYDKLETEIRSLVETDHPGLIFAESVGSCTDIVATVIKPLLKYHPDAGLSFSTFADARLLHMLLNGKAAPFDEKVRYIYYKQLEEAGIIVISKIDLISDALLEEVKLIMQEKYPGKTVLYQNSLDPAGIDQWLQASDQYQAVHTLRSLEIDYDIYGAGEARLAWLDQELEIYSVENNAWQNATTLINRIYKKITEKHWPIGHLKFIVDGETKISYTSGAEAEMTGELINKKASGSATLLINARVQTEPEQLATLISDAINETEAGSACKIIIGMVSYFQPGYPKPTHRIADNN
jgi:Ni2+-binding GTPase involved in maturation of urease and hydrogenase